MSRIPKFSCYKYIKFLLVFLLPTIEVLSCWFQGGLTATDVFAVEWIQTGVIHFGMTVSYYGFVSDGMY